MTKDLFKDFLREIRKSANRFLSILCIVAIGVAFFVGLKSSAPDMSYTMDDYYDQYNIMDIQIASTLGLTDDDITAISEIPQVEKVQAGYFTDALAAYNGTEYVFRIHSMPESYIKDGTDCINEVKVVEGRLPENSNEIVIEDSQNMDAGIKIGDELTFTSGTDTKLTDGVLKNDTFVVVGKVTTPYYLTYEKGTSQIGGKSINFFSYIQEGAFDYGDIYTEALVLVSGARQLNAFTDKYKNLIYEVSNVISNTGVDRAHDRSESVKEAAYEELDKAQEEYDKQLKEFNEKIAAAEKELEEGYTELVKGEAELQSEKEKYEIEIKHAQDQITEGEKELQDAATAITEGKQQLAEAEEQYNTAKSEYDEALEQNQKYIDALNSLSNSMGSLNSMLEQSKQEYEDIMNDPNATEEEKEEAKQNYESMNSLYESFNENYQEIKGLSDSTNNLVESLGASLETTQKQLESAKTELAEAEKEYAEGQQKLNSAKSQLAQQKAAAQQQFAEAQKKLDDGWKEYDEGVEELEKQRKEGQKQLDEASLQLIEAKYQIELMENAEWYVLNRTTNYGFSSYQSTVDRMDALAQLMPIFFILVAVLVCMTTMTRMITEQRGNIGTYKALGYGDIAIASKYVMYVVTASVIGAVLGAVLGSMLFPKAVYTAWAAMYNQPELKQIPHVGIVVIAFAASVIAMAATAYYTCHVELITVPAQLMRPKSPKLGKAIFMERIPAIWDHLNFSQKVTVRNIFRYKKRLFMTIIGIMGCTALLLAGLGMNDTISTVVSNQYEKIFKYDMSVSVSDASEEQNPAAQTLSQNEAVESFGYAGATSLTLAYENASETATAYVVEDTAILGDYITLQTRVSGNKLSVLNDGIIITEKLAEQLGVSVGDTVDVMNSDNMMKKIPISGITENYVFHYVYMSQECYQNYFWMPVNQNEIFVKLVPTCTSEQETALFDELSNTEGVTSVISYTDLAEEFNEQIIAMKSIIVLIIICAALLAFVVLYNLTNINVSERIREIATIKVLGFKSGETAMYVYRENFVLTVMGSVIGLALGVVLHRFIMKAIEQNNIMFGYVINPLSFLWSVLLTCAFSILVMVYMYRKLINIPMVESLKTVE